MCDAHYPFLILHRTDVKSFSRDNNHAVGDFTSARCKIFFSGLNLFSVTITTQLEILHRPDVKSFFRVNFYDHCNFLPLGNYH